MIFRKTFTSANDYVTASADWDIFRVHVPGFT